MLVTAQILVNAIKNLPDKEFTYVNERNAGLIVVHEIRSREGPIFIKRYNPTRGGTPKTAKRETISSVMIWRLANAISEGRPLNVDRVFGGSYNTRSVLESLVAHTPQFYWCRPTRVETINDVIGFKKGHKHLIWLPNSPHSNGILEFFETDLSVQEINLETIHDEITLKGDKTPQGLTHDELRMHAQIQVELAHIGHQLDFKTWIAANDHSIQYGQKRIIELDGVIKDLNSQQSLVAYPSAISAARLIDCVWFKNGKMMPAVMEIEHSTGVTSGLTRMRKFYDKAPKLENIRWTVVAPDSTRSKVIAEAQADQYRELKPKFLPYSAVHELYELCDRRKPKGITDEFLDCFMEECLD